jgi:chemoreceptor zinc-binding protein
MADKPEIDKAIAAHGMWKTRLKMAIETGKLETPVETIRMDNQCVFGKWLYGTTLTSVDKASIHYKTVKELHTEFHKTAARVAELAFSANKIEAEEMMSLGGEFAAVSEKLTTAMVAWKKSLGY